MNNIKILLFVLVVEILGVIGQTLFKTCLNDIHTPDMRDWRSYILFIKNVLSRRFVWLGVFFVSLSILMWLAVLAQADLSRVYPMESLQYIVTLFFAWGFLREKIGIMKLLGTALIILGIILINFC